MEADGYGVDTQWGGRMLGRQNMVLVSEKSCVVYGWMDGSHYVLLYYVMRVFCWHAWLLVLGMMEHYCLLVQE